MRTPAVPSAPKNPAPTCDKLWTVDDVSAFLGVPRNTLYQWRTRGEGPPCVRLGKHLRFDPDRVRAWFGDQVA